MRFWFFFWFPVAHTFNWGCFVVIQLYKIVVVVLSLWDFLRPSPFYIICKSFHSSHFCFIIISMCFFKFPRERLRTLVFLARFVDLGSSCWCSCSMRTIPPLWSRISSTSYLIYAVLTPLGYSITRCTDGTSGKPLAYHAFLSEQISHSSWYSGIRDFPLTWGLIFAYHEMLVGDLSN